MLKLATVFSGIGAIEHALKRMGIPHEIVFACDNGDVDIFTNKVDFNFAEIRKRIYDLEQQGLELEQKTKDDDMDYLYNLEQHIHKLKVVLDEVENEYILTKLNSEQLLALQELIDSYNGKTKNNTILLEVKEKNNEIWISLQSLFELDKLKDKIEIKAPLKEKILVNDYKNKRKLLHQALEELYMADEKIQTLNILNNLKEIDDYSQKKKYVDELYDAKKGSNFVRKSYFANYKIDEERFHWNVSFLDGNQYKDEVDLFVGGSPCQSFSLVGKQRGLGDTRGTLFYEYARLIKEIQPKVFIYENVRAVLSNDEGRTWQTMTQVFEELGYTWKMQTLNARDYGVPQNRERIFVVGIRNDLEIEKEFTFPEKQELQKTMKDFLLDNVSGKYYLGKKGVDFVTDEKNLSKRFTQVDGDVQLCQKKNQQFNWHGDFVFVEENKDLESTIQDLEKYFLSEKVRKYVLATGTGNFYSRPEIDLDVARPLLTTMHKMHRAGVDNYVTTDGRIRKLHPRECLRLMGYCDSFKIVVSDTQMYQQAGNSIVVDVLIAVMNQLIEALPQIARGTGYKYKNNQQQIELNQIEQLAL